MLAGATSSMEFGEIFQAKAYLEKYLKMKCN